MVTKKDKYLAAAQKFLEKGQVDKALLEFGKVVAEDPKDTRTWLRMAELHVKRGDSEKAAETYLRTAELYTEQGFFQKAVAVYKNVIKLSPGAVHIHFKLADLFKQLGLLQDAMQQFELAGALHQKAGRTAEALEALRQIVELGPDNIAARIKLAEAASQAGEAAEAIREFKRSADTLRAQGRTDEYLKVAERMLFHQPDNLGLARELAEAYIQRGNARFALPKLQACFKADARDPTTLALLARAFEQLGQIPKTVSVLKELAKLCHEQGRTGERNEALRKALALDPNDAEARDAAVRYGLMAPTKPAQAPSLGLRPEPVAAPARRVAGAAAAEEALESVEQAGTDVARILAESEVFIKYGLLERAADHLRRVFEIQAHHPGAREKLVTVLVQLGRVTEAVAEMESMAEQLAARQPQEAAEFARRALALDPRAPRARGLLQVLEAGSAAGAEADEDLPVATPEIDLDDGAEGLVSDDAEPQESGPVIEVSQEGPIGLPGMDDDLPVVVPEETPLVEVSADDSTGEESLDGDALLLSPEEETGNDEPLVEVAADDYGDAGPTGVDDGFASLPPEPALAVPAGAARGVRPSGPALDDEDLVDAAEELPQQEFEVVQRTHASGEFELERKTPAGAEFDRDVRTPSGEDFGDDGSTRFDDGAIARLAAAERSAEPEVELVAESQDATAIVPVPEPTARGASFDAAAGTALGEQPSYDEGEPEAIAGADGEVQEGGAAYEPAMVEQAQEMPADESAAAAAPELAADLVAAEDAPEPGAIPHGAGAPDELDQELAGELEQVDFFVQQGLPDEARSLLDDLDQRFPGQPAVAAKRAEVDDQSAGEAAAVDPEAQVPAEGPSDAGAPRVRVSGAADADHKDLAMMYQSLGDFDAAVREFDSLAQVDPAQEVFALTMIGECHEARSAVTEAVMSYKKALNVAMVTDQEMLVLYYHLGNAYELLEDAKEALYFFEKVAKREPRFQDVATRIAALKQGGQIAGRPAGASADDVDVAFDDLLGEKKKS